jgi:hypothetical protein
MGIAPARMSDYPRAFVRSMAEQMPECSVFRRLGLKSALMNQLSNKAVEQKTLGSKLLMTARHFVTPTHQGLGKATSVSRIIG